MRNGIFKKFLYRMGIFFISKQNLAISLISLSKRNFKKCSSYSLPVKVDENPKKLSCVEYFLKMSLKKYRLEAHLTSAGKRSAQTDFCSII